MKNLKFKGAMGLASAVTLLHTSTVNTFTQPDVTSTSRLCNSNHNAIMGASYSSSSIESICTSSSETSLSSHISQHDSIPLIDTESELSEFLGRSLSGDILGKCNAEDNLPLFMTLSDEQREFDLKIGKALDTLRGDYPNMLTENPDFSIYHPQIEVVDPKGITLHSLQSYKTSFQFLHIILNLFYSPHDSDLTFRLVYDCARKSIRVSWNAILTPRMMMGGVVHVDGISVYEFDRASGLINQHRVEHLLVNDAPVEAPQGLFRAIANHAMAGPDAEGVPVWNIDTKSRHGNNINGKTVIGNVLEFKSGKKDNIWMPPSSLFLSTETAASDGDYNHPLFDQEAFEKKNASRKKFGVPPLTPDEFVQIQAQVKEMESAQQEKQKALGGSSSSSTEIAKSKESKGNILGRMFGNILQNTCETNYDCERPEVCCDLGFKKMCCSSGMRVFDPQPNLQKIPVRVVADDGMYPRGGPDGMDNYY